jgi:isoleucyl-tRNA synthetase
MEGFNIEQNLVDSMDIVRAICGTILSIRDKNNLRVRLPLNKMTVITHDIDRIKDFSSIILDEVNIKNIEFLTDIENYGEKKLTLNFSKVGEKIGAKMQAVVTASKNNKWSFNKNNKLEIEGFELNNDEYTISWISKRNAVFAVPGYDILILLDLNITLELEQEGMARDIVRMVQQYRKEAELDVSDKIELSLTTSDNFVKESIENHKDYIKYQTLASELAVESDENNKEFNFRENLEKHGILLINFNKIN